MYQFAGTQILMCVNEPPSVGGVCERAPKFAERTRLRACTRVATRVCRCLILTASQGLCGCMTHVPVRWNPNFDVCERAPKRAPKVGANEPPSLPSARACALARALQRACVGASHSPHHGASLDMTMHQFANPNFVCEPVCKRAPKRAPEVGANEPPSLPSARACALARALQRACVGASHSPHHGASLDIRLMHQFAGTQILCASPCANEPPSVHPKLARTSPQVCRAHALARLHARCNAR